MPGLRADPGAVPVRRARPRQRPALRGEDVPRHRPEDLREGQVGLPAVLQAGALVVADAPDLDLVAKLLEQAGAPGAGGAGDQHHRGGAGLWDQHALPEQLVEAAQLGGPAHGPAAQDVALGHLARLGRLGGAHRQLERGEQLAGGAGPLGRVLVQQPPEQRLERVRQRARRRGVEVGLVLQVVVHHLLHRAVEQRAAGDDVVEHRAQRVEVQPRVHRVAAEHLRGQVVDGPLEHARVADGGLLHQAEVHHLHGAVLAHHDVVRLEVEVDEALRVDVLERPGDLDRVVVDRLEIQPAGGGQEIFPLHVLHGEEVVLGPADGAELVHLHHVGVVEGGHRLELVLEGAVAVGADELPADGLQGLELVLLQGVLDQEDLAHGAGPELSDHAVSVIEQRLRGRARRRLHPGLPHVRSKRVYCRAEGPFKEERTRWYLGNSDGSGRDQGADRFPVPAQSVPAVRPAPGGRPRPLARAGAGMDVDPPRRHHEGAAGQAAGQPVPAQAVRDAATRGAVPLRAHAAVAPALGAVPRPAGPHPGARADGPGVHPQGGPGAAAGHRGDCPDAPGPGGGAREVDGADRGPGLPAADHGDRRAPGRAPRGARTVQALGGRAGPPVGPPPGGRGQGAGRLHGLERDERLLPAPGGRAPPAAAERPVERPGGGGGAGPHAQLRGSSPTAPRSCTPGARPPPT